MEEVQTVSIPVAEAVEVKAEPKAETPPGAKFDPETGKPIAPEEKGAKFDPETGKPIPKFDAETGKQNWW